MRWGASRIFLFEHGVEKNIHDDASVRQQDHGNKKDTAERVGEINTIVGGVITTDFGAVLAAYLVARPFVLQGPRQGSFGYCFQTSAR
jgi:hypothetical protein